MPMNADYRGPVDLPPIIPLFPLAGALLLPRGQLPLNIFEPRYLDLIKRCGRSGEGFGICLILQGEEVGAPAIPAWKTSGRCITASADRYPPKLHPRIATRSRSISG